MSEWTGEEGGEQGCVGEFEFLVPVAEADG